MKSMPKFFLFVLIIMYQLPFLQVGISYASNSDQSPSVNELPSRMIDLYTQKEPYGGKGLNQPSDAFAPQERVVLYAYVTYRDCPVSNKIVGFDIHGPINSVENVSFIRTALTDASGVATISFRIPWPAENPETIVFGVWNVHASVEIAEVPVRDDLSFKVGWLVEIISVVTVDENLRPETKFVRECCVGVKIVLANIAMLSKTVTLTVTAQDASNIVFPNRILLEDFVVEPEKTYVYVYCVLQIPEEAALGKASVAASAFEGGVACCPEKSAEFAILSRRDVRVVSVVPLAKQVAVGEVVDINVTVLNEGDVPETFDVEAYYDSELIGSKVVEWLAPGEWRELTFVWNTSYVDVGSYTLKANASVLPSEMDVEDNTYIDGKVWVGIPLPVVAPARACLIILLICLVIMAVILATLLLYGHKRRPSSESREEDSWWKPFVTPAIILPSDEEE